MSSPAALPFAGPVAPMLAKRVDRLPDGAGWLFEPKWDGFRAIVFRNGDELRIQSRDLKPLNRYFPELEATLKAALPERCVVDGEVVIAGAAGLEFDALTLRIHPAASRVRKLADEMPASMVVFDLLALENRDLRAEPFATRRAELERVLGGAHGAVHITPATTDHALAEDWFRRFEGAGLDGVMAKRADGIYEPDKRVMLKVKHERECDCVVAGFRWHKDGEGRAVGSLLLGLYNDAGALQHVGVCASFTAAKRVELLTLLEPYRTGIEGHPWVGADAMGGRVPGAPSRWNSGKDLHWEALRPELVAEVAYEHMQGDRFRHLAHFRRWRADRTPQSCTYEQLEVVPAMELREIFGSGS